MQLVTRPYIPVSPARLISPDQRAVLEALAKYGPTDFLQLYQQAFVDRNNRHTRIHIADYLFALALTEAQGLIKIRPFHYQDNQPKILSLTRLGHAYSEYGLF